MPLRNSPSWLPIAAVSVASGGPGGEVTAEELGDPDDLTGEEQRERERAAKPGLHGRRATREVRVGKNVRNTDELPGVPGAARKSRPTDDDVIPGGALERLGLDSGTPPEPDRPERAAVLVEAPQLADVPVQGAANGLEDPIDRRGLVAGRGHARPTSFWSSARSAVSSER